MKWPGPVVEGMFLARRKRFFADMQLIKGTAVTAHCANTGSMKTCLAVGAPSILTVHDDPKRKLKYSWQAIEMPDGWVGINTGLANRLVVEAFELGLIEALHGYTQHESERKVSAHSRIDHVFMGPGLPDVYVEVKNVTLLAESAGCVTFPDAKTTRGTKHLRELVDLIGAGHEALLCFCVQRNSAQSLALYQGFDPEYAATLEWAIQQGLHVVALKCWIDEIGVAPKQTLPLWIKPA